MKPKFLDFLIIVAITFVLACTMTGAKIQFERVPYLGGETTSDDKIILKPGNQYNWWLITTPKYGAKESFQVPIPGVWTVK